MRKRKTTGIVGAILVMAMALSPAQADYKYFRMNGGGSYLTSPETPPPANTLAYSIVGLTSATVGQNYTATAQVTGAAGQPSFSLQSGQIPSGLSLDPNSGELSGAPTAAGTFDGVLKVTDSASAIGQASFHIVISNPLVVDWFPATGKVGQVYSPTAPIIAGGRAPFSYDLTGATPDGLSFASTTGLLTGTPIQAGDYALAASVTDADGRQAATGPKTLTVASADVDPQPDPLAIQGTPGVETEIGVTYLAHFSATGGEAPYIFDLVTGTLPHGISIASDGTISGTPDTAGVSSGLQVRVTDGLGSTALSGVFSITVTPQAVLQIAGTPSETAHVAQVYNAAFTAFDGSGSGYVFSSIGNPLPAGLSLINDGDGTAHLSGTPSQAGTFAGLQIGVTDSANNTAASTIFTIAVAPDLQISGNPPAIANVGTLYSTQFSASGTSGAVTYAVASGSLPAWLSLNPTTGVLAGTPSASDVGTVGPITVSVTDSASTAVSNVITISVSSPLVFANSNATIYQGDPYAIDLVSITSGGVAPYTYAMISGSIPAGIAVSSTGGNTGNQLSATVITGTSATSTFKVTDTFGRETTATISLSVVLPSAPSGSFVAGAVSDNYNSGPLQTNGGVAPFIWNVSSGTLPPGLSLNSSTGIITGAPTTAGNYTFVVTAKDSRSITSAGSSQSVAIATALTLTGTSSVTGVSGDFSYAPTVTGGVGGNVFSATNGTGTLADLGLSLNTSTGEISGTAIIGNWSGSISVVNAAGTTKTLSLSIVIKPAGQSNITSWALATGDGAAAVQHPTPFSVLGGKNYVKIVGVNGICGVVGDGTTECWGQALGNALTSGMGSTPLLPTRVPNLDGASDLVANSSNVCAIYNGGVKCWGNNSEGQIGDGTQAAKSVPTQVSGLTSGVTQIAISPYGTNSACAIQSGALKCWGYVFSTNSTNTTPITVIASGVDKITIGQNHACAIVSGAAKCWGTNSSGQIGDGTKVSKTAPTQVTGLSTGVTDLSAGLNYTCAIQSGSAKCWGINSTGQIGDGSSLTTARTSPSQVSGITSGASKIVTTNEATCALVSNSVECWGYSGNGDLGNGTMQSGVSSYVPVQVINLPSSLSELTAAGNIPTFAVR